MKAAEELAVKGVQGSVIDMHTLKPLEMSLVDTMATIFGCLVTAEDHSVIGGLGAAVAEYLSRIDAVPLEMVGVDDEFGQGGEPLELMQSLGLTSDDITSSAMRVIGRKSG